MLKSASTYLVPYEYIRMFFLCAKAVKCTAFVGATCCLNLIGGPCKIEYSNQSSLSVSSTLNCLYKVPFFLFLQFFFFLPLGHYICILVYNFVSL